MQTVIMERSQLGFYGHSAVMYNKVELAEPSTVSDAYIIPAAELFAIGFNCTPNGLIEFTMASIAAIENDTADWGEALQDSPINPAVTAWRVRRSDNYDNTGTVIGAVTIKGKLE